MTSMRERIKQALRAKIRVDATGLSPAVASALVIGFDDAADAVLAELREPSEGMLRELAGEILYYNPEQWVCSATDAAKSGWQAAIDHARSDSEERKQAMAWRTIESAPKDGTMILIFVPAKAMKRRYSLNGSGEVFAGRFNRFFSRWITSPGDYAMRPSHWQPLPDPPADWIPEGHVVVEGMEEPSPGSNIKTSE